MSKYFVNWRPLKSQSLLSLFKARPASKPAQSMASFKSSSDCSRPCPVMCSIPPEMGIPQLSSPALMLDHFTVKSFFSISSEFPFILPHSFTSRTWLHHPPASFRQVRLPSAPSLHCLSSRLHRCSYQWLLCYNTDWLRASPLGYLSLPVFFLLRESLEEHSTGQQPHMCWTEGKHWLGWTCWAALPPSLPQPQALAADSRRTCCCSQTPWSCFAALLPARPPRPATVSPIIPPHTRALLSPARCLPAQPQSPARWGSLRTAPTSSSRE